MCNHMVCHQCVCYKFDPVSLALQFCPSHNLTTVRLNNFKLGRDVHWGVGVGGVGGGETSSFDLYYWSEFTFYASDVNCLKMHY